MLFIFTEDLKKQGVTFNLNNWHLMTFSLNLRLAFDDRIQYIVLASDDDYTGI